MPEYTYKCKHCKNIFEETHQMSESNIPQPCPDCESLSDRYYSYAPNFFFVDKPGANIIDRSPMKDFNNGMPDDIRL